MKNKTNLFIIFCVLLEITFAFDLEITKRDNTLIQNETCTNLFEIRNLNYYENKTIVNLSFRYIVEFENEIIKAENLDFIDFKFRKYSGTGEFVPLEFGEYKICGEIISSTFFDNNTKNNKLCYNLTLSEFKEICDFSLDILVENKIISKDEKIRFKPFVKNTYFNSSKEHLFRIEYWIEDINKNIIKKKINTSVNSFKTFSLKSHQPQTLIIKANISYLSCNDINNKNNYLEIPVIFQNEIPNKEEFKINNLRQITQDIIILEFSIFKNMTEKNEIKFFMLHKDKKISNDFNIKINSQLQDVNFEIPLIFSNEELNVGKNNVKLFVEAFGKKYENIISINKKNNTIKIPVENSSSLNIKNVTTKKTKLENNFFKQFIAFSLCCFVIIFS